MFGCRVLYSCTRIIRAWFGVWPLPYWTIDATCIFMGISCADSSSLDALAHRIHHFSIQSNYRSAMPKPIDHDFQWNSIFHVFSLLAHGRAAETDGEKASRTIVCVNIYTGIAWFRFMLAGNLWRPFELCNHQNVRMNPIYIARYCYNWMVMDHWHTYLAASSRVKIPIIFCLRNQDIHFVISANELCAAETITPTNDWWSRSWRDKMNGNKIAERAYKWRT